MPPCLRTLRLLALVQSQRLLRAKSGVQPPGAGRQARANAAAGIVSEALARPWLPGGASRACRRSDAAAPGARLRLLARVRVVTKGLLCTGGPSLGWGECSARAPTADALRGGLRERRAAALAANGRRRVQRRAGGRGVKRLCASIAPGFLRVCRHRL